MNSVFDLASRLSTPIAVSGFIAAIFFYILRQLISRGVFPTVSKGHSAKIIVLIIERLFILSLVALILGFAGYIVAQYAPNPVGPTGPTGETEERVENGRLGGGYLREIPYPDLFYSGPLKNKIPHGRGRLTAKDDSRIIMIYEGDFAEGKFHGMGELTDFNAPATKAGFSSNFVKGRFEAGELVSGKGRIWYSEFFMPLNDGTRFGYESGAFEGELRGVPNANYSIDSNGNKTHFYDHLEGIVQPFGEGVFKHYNGNLSVVFEGQWKDFAFTGIGSIRITENGNAATLEGEFKQGQLISGRAKGITEGKTGMGAQPSLGPVIYDGEIKNGKMDGEGELRSADIKLPIAFKGTFKDGKWWTGTGISPMRADTEKNEWPYGEFGRWKDGIFFEGYRLIPFQSNDGKIPDAFVYRSDYVGGVSVKYERIRSNDSP